MTRQFFIMSVFLCAAQAYAGDVATKPMHLQVTTAKSSPTYKDYLEKLKAFLNANNTTPKSPEAQAVRVVLDDMKARDRQRNTPKKTNLEQIEQKSEEVH